MHTCRFLAKQTGCIIGMIHFPPLPGSFSYGGESFDQIAERVLEDAKALKAGGVDAILIQNTGNLPTTVEGDFETVAYMSVLGMLIRREVGMPLGVNVLKNGTESALAIAHAIGAVFVRIKVYVGAVVGAEGIEEGTARKALQFRRRIGAEDIAIVADIHDRTSVPLGAMTIRQAADLAWHHGHADGLVITGRSVPETLDWLRQVREAVSEAPIWAGGGTTADNVAEFLKACDGIIVGTSIKAGSKLTDPIDRDKLARYMDAVRRARKP